MCSRGRFEVGWTSSRHASKRAQGLSSEDELTVEHAVRAVARLAAPGPWCEALVRAGVVPRLLAALQLSAVLRPEHARESSHS